MIEVTWLALLQFIRHWICRIRGYHKSPPGWGWLRLKHGGGEFCHTCGKLVRLGTDKIRRHRDAYGEPPK